MKHVVERPPEIKKPIVIENRPAPERHEPAIETPSKTGVPRRVAPDEPKTRVVVRQGGAEKSGGTVAEKEPARPELLTVQQKVKRLGELEKTNLNSTPPQITQVKRVIAQLPKTKVAVAVQPVRPDPVLTQAHARLDLAVLDKLPMKLSKVLKGNEGKLTCMLDVGGVTYIVKVGGGYTTMQDHIANTDLISRLDIAGVRAPLTREMSDDFVTALKGQLKSANPSDKQLLDALGTFDQISKIAPGLTVQDVFDPENAALGGLLDTIRNKSTEAAALALTSKLEESLNARPTMDKVNGLKLIANLKNPPTRTDAINQLKTLLNIPANKQILSVLDRVNQQGADAIVQSMTSDISKLATAKTKLTSFAASEAGGYALGGMAVTDMLIGMDDRIVGGKFNGGNFMFDPDKSQLWCVDNSKDPKYALSSNNPGEWKTFALRAMTDDTGTVDDAQAIADRLHFLVYGRKTQEPTEIPQNVQLGGNETALTTGGIRRAVTETLQKMRDLVNDNGNGLPAPERAKLKARIEFIDARQTFLDLLPFDATFQNVPSTTKPGVLKVFGRNVKGLIAGRTDSAELAEKMKLQARDPATTDDVLQAIDEGLTEALSQPKFADADQRFLKALFAARSERFRRSVLAKTTALTNLSAGGKKAWGDVSPAVIKATVTDIADPWLAKFDALGDKTGKAALDTAVKTLVSQLNSQL